MLGTTLIKNAAIARGMTNISRRPDLAELELSLMDCMRVHLLVS